MVGARLEMKVFVLQDFLCRTVKVTCSLRMASVQGPLLVWDGSGVAADVYGAPTAVPAPPWSFLKPLCLLIAGQLPSSVPRLCAGTTESALEGR